MKENLEKAAFEKAEKIQSQVRKQELMLKKSSDIKRKEERDKKRKELRPIICYRG